jgi:E3 ubiquitin-protein ligase RBBP6
MSIHYKFRSAREYDTITVDGGFISLFDLKKAIIEAKKLGKSMDLDLEVVNAQTNEAYTDESTLIPKNTSVIVRRVPTTKMASIVQPASAPTHVAVMQEKPIEVPAPQQPQMQYTQQYAPVQPQVAPLVVPTESGTPNVGGEEDRIMALINQADDWHATGTTKDTGMTPGGHRGGGKFTRQYEQKTPPPNYICHRCNQPGHFINQCPTNGDPSFDIPKVKKPTGIPRMYLKPVAGGDSRPSLILPGGQFAVMAANEEALQKEVAKNKQVDTSIPDSLRCPLCGGLLNDAVLIPCCGYSFCEECMLSFFTVFLYSLFYIQFLCSFLFIPFSLFLFYNKCLLFDSTGALLRVRRLKPPPRDPEG